MTPSLDYTRSPISPGVCVVEVLRGGNADSLIVDENEGGAGQGDYEVVVAVVELAH